MIEITCDRCSVKLRQFGALAFSPPSPPHRVGKYHLCIACWTDFLDWLR